MIVIGSASTASGAICRYTSADALIQPSQYQPFALTFGEVLASGIPVIASDEVGATKGVDPRRCTVFKAGHLDAFEAAVRALLDRLASGAKPDIATIARAEACCLFSIERVVDRILLSFEATLARRNGGEPLWQARAS